MIKEGLLDSLDYLEDRRTDRKSDVIAIEKFNQEKIFLSRHSHHHNTKENVLSSR